MTRDNDIADQLFGNSAPITTLKSSLLSLSSRLEHRMSEIRDMTYDKKQVKSDAHCVEELDGFLNSSKSQAKALEKSIIPIMDSMLHPIGNTNKTLSEIVHAMDQMVYLNYELLEKIEEQLKAYGYHRNEANSSQGMSTPSDSSSRHQSYTLPNHSSSHNNHRSFTVLSPLEEEDESLINEEDNSPERRSLDRTESRTPRTPTIETLGFSPTKFTLQNGELHDEVPSREMDNDYFDEHSDYSDDSDDSIENFSILESLNGTKKIGSPFEELLKSPERPKSNRIEMTANKAATKITHNFNHLTTNDEVSSDGEICEGNGNKKSSLRDRMFFSNHTVTNSDHEKAGICYNDTSTIDNTFQRIETRDQCVDSSQQSRLLTDQNIQLSLNHIDAIIDESLLISKSRSSSIGNDDNNKSDCDEMSACRYTDVVEFQSPTLDYCSIDNNNGKSSDESVLISDQPSIDDNTFHDKEYPIASTLLTDNHADVSPTIHVEEEQIKETHAEKIKDEEFMLVPDLESLKIEENDDSVSTDFSESSPIRNPNDKSTVKARRISPHQLSDMKQVGKALFNDIQSSHYSETIPISIRRSSLERTPKAAAWLAKHNMLHGAEKENLTSSALNIIANTANDAEMGISKKNTLKELNLTPRVDQNKVQESKILYDNEHFIQRISSNEYDAAPRIVKMQVTLEQVNNAVDLINQWWKAKAGHQAKLFITEDDASIVLGEHFPPRKCKSVLCALCHWKKMTIEINNHGTGRIFVGI